ncbi:MAG: response regulator [Salinivirgaceae bacterium]|nr:response regulator [Salinivirgaceae bacterium]
MLIDKEYNWQNKVILIAEDEETNYLLVEKFIKSTQATLLRAKNGKEAVDIVKSGQNIDLVLMDMKMPEMDGIEASKIIRELKPKLPIIAQTCYEPDIDQSRLLNAHFEGFISKPININKLIELIDKHL